jgi:hypothetical protein
MPATLEKNRLDRCVESQNEDLEQILFEDLSRRLDCLWRYDQYIASSDGLPELRDFWRVSKLQEQRDIEQLRKLIQQHSRRSGFAVLMSQRK